MIVLSLLLRLITPSAHAMALQDLGAENSGVQSMWDTISDTFPFSGAGSDLPGFIFARIATLVIILIAFVAVALVTYAAARLAMGGWHEESVAESKRIIKNVVIGLIAAVVADAVIWYVSWLLMTIGNA